MSRSDELKSAMRKKQGSDRSDGGRVLSTGSTMLNLACTGKPDGGFLEGHYYLLVGDSDSGKTFLSLTCLAEAAKNPEFDDYRLIYDGPEGGALMDIERFFGSKVAGRMEPPGLESDGSPHYSSTVQEFYYHVDDALKKGKPFIYILDSQDCLSSREEISKFEEVKQAFRKGKEKEITGSYGDSKAKCHSANMRKLMGPLRESGSILIVINQTRDSFNMFESSTYSGGRALKFYSTLQIWSSPCGKIEKNVRGKKRQLGVFCKVRVKKNRVTGRDRSVVIPIYHSFGIDDIGGCVDYLVAEGVWVKDGSKICATSLGPDHKSDREGIVKWIEEGALEDDLRQQVEETWNEIENSCSIHRRKRYN